MERIPMSQIPSEQQLEDALANDISILSPRLMLLGRQVQTSYGKFIDLLAMDADGNLTVIELKRARTPRDVVSQAIDYASWAQNLSYQEIADLFAEKNPGKNFEEAFEDQYGANPPDELNTEHEIIVVASDLDPSTERIIGYLTDNFGVPVNAVYFRHFSDDGSNYLARTWLIDPEEAERKSSQSMRSKKKEPWNGHDFYVSLGESDRRNWEDCVRYGFISGGGGKWYTQTLEALFPGARIWVNLPSQGYVGVGEVVDGPVPVAEFTIKDNGKTIPILHADLKATNLGEDKDDPARREMLVRVDWIETKPRAEAYREKGFFGSQHTACRFRNQFTLDRLRKHFGVTD